GHETETRNTDPPSAEYSAARAALLEVARPAQGRLARHEGEVQLGGEARCLATRGTHRSGRDPGSRCPAVMAAAFPQGPLVLHAGHTGRSHPAAVRVRRTGTGGRLTEQRNGTGKRHPPALSGHWPEPGWTRWISSPASRWERGPVRQGERGYCHGGGK